MNTTATSLVEKWRHLFPENPRNEWVLARVMENQEREFHNLAANFPDRMPPGTAWWYKIIRAIARGLNLSPLQDMVYIQPFDRPIMQIVRTVANDSIHPWALPTRVDPVEIRVESRKSRQRIRTRPSTTPLQDFTEQVFGVDEFQREVNQVFEEFFSEDVVREVMSAILYSTSESGRTKRVRDPHLLRSAVDHGCAEIYRKTSREPDWYLMSPRMAEAAQYCRELGRIHIDPCLPDDLILLFSSPRGLHDATVVYSPYYFGFDAVADTYALRARQKITMLSTDGSYLVGVGEP